MNSYQTKGYSQYGASMGRGSDLPEDSAGPLTIRKVPIDAGGYDPGGAYWGSPADLYCVTDEDGRTSYQRAASFDAARAKFPRATWAEPSLVAADIEDMLTAYIEAALWSTNDESDESGGAPFDDNYSAADLDPLTREKMRGDCIRFVEHNAWTFAHILSTGDLDWTQVGHDFWLSRNGHGVGFRDRKCYAGHEQDLDDACGWRTTFGEVNLYLDDDGKIHQG